MKIFRYFFLMTIIIVSASCSGTSEEQLVGDWDRRTVFSLSGRCHAATFVIENRGYVVGGYNGTNPPCREVFAFYHNEGTPVRDDRDGRTMGRWEELEELPDFIAERQQAVGFSLRASDGKYYGYMGSGWVWNAPELENETVKDFYRYDPSKEGSGETCWEPIAPLPENFKVRRGAFAFSLEVDGKMYGYVGGGFTDRPRNEYLNDLWKYDPDTDSWIEIAHGSFGKRLGGMAFVLNGKAYICSGENSTGSINDFYVFDPYTETFEQLRTMTKVHPDDTYDTDYVSLRRTYGVAFVVPVSGVLRGHIVGGMNTEGATCWEYNETDDLWTQRTSFINNTNRNNREGMVSFYFPETGRAFAGLGRSGVSFYADDMWEFIPLADDNMYRDRVQ